MRRLLLAMAILAISAGVAFAGPNAGVVLAVQGNALGVATNGVPCTAIALPATCEELVTGATESPTTDNVSWYLAVVVSPPENTPNFNTVVFGLGAFNMADNYISFTGACVTGALEVSTAGWPGPGEGTAVSWAPGCLYGYMEPVYYFGTYNYNGGVIPLGVHPVQGGVVVDCSADPQEDPFVGFGAMEGANPTCPGGQPVPGACCFGPTCVMLTETECADQTGVWYGGDCGPNNEPCPQEPTPTNETTWGSIKNIYR